VPLIYLEPLYFNQFHPTKILNDIVHVQYRTYIKISFWSIFHAPNILLFQLRREFDTERVQEEEEFENSHPSTGSNNKNSSNGEAK